MANIKDFYNKEGNPKIGMEFHVYTYHSMEIERHELHNGQEILKYYPWIKDNRVFIPKDGISTPPSPKKNVIVVEPKKDLKLDEF